MLGVQLGSLKNIPDLKGCLASSPWQTPRLPAGEKAIHGQSRMHKTASSCIRRVTHAGDTWETHRRTGPHLRPPPSGDPVSGSRWDPSILLPCHSAFWGDSHTPLFLLHHLNPLPPFNVAQEPCTQLDGLKKESKSHSVTSDSVTPSSDLRHPSQVYRNINFSKATGWKTRAPHIV